MNLFEDLIINDGSKDGTSEIGHHYETMYPDTFRVIDKDNGHYGSCVNAGLARAQGKYVKILDADDYLASGFVDYLSYLDQTFADLVLTDSITIDEKGNELSKKQFPFSQFDTMNIQCLGDNGINVLNHFNITWKTTILKEMGYRQTEGLSYTDLEWSTLPVSRITSFAYCPTIVYCYLKGRSGQSVDIEYRKNNMWMENKVVLGLASIFEESKDEIPADNASLLKQITAYHVQHVYFHYLINYPHDLNEQELVSFDDNLKSSSPMLYDFISETQDIRKFGTFHYIRDFRKKGTRNTLKYAYYDACFAIKSLIKKNN